MQSRPDLALIGSQAFRIDEEGRRVGMLNRCLEHETAVWCHLFENPFIHTSVMFRRAIVRELGGYDAGFDPLLEDYALWSNVLQRFRTLNVAERLVEYRIVSSSMTGDLLDVPGRKDHPRHAAFARVLRRLVGRNLRATFPGDVSDVDAEIASRFLLGLDPQTVDAFLSLYFRLLARFRTMHAQTLRSGDFTRTLGRHFDALAYRTAPYTRAAAIRVCAKILRKEPAAAGAFPWGRIGALVTLGRDRRRRLKRFEATRAGG
jgi:hypothetical protein